MSKRKANTIYDWLRPQYPWPIPETNRTLEELEEWQKRTKRQNTTQMYIQVFENEVNRYIDNHLPIHLLDLHSMRLIHRTQLAGIFAPDIQKYCFESEIVSKSGHLQFDPAYVETLRSDAKTWIKDTKGYAILSHRWGRNELTFSDISQFANIGHGSDKSATPIKSTRIPKKVIDLAKRSERTPNANFDFKFLEAMTALCKNEDFKDHQGFVKIIQFFAKSREYQCDYVWFDTGCIDRTSSAELEESIRSMFNWYRNSKICIIHLSKTSNKSNMHSDPWFTRGWTLQELLAPPRVKFLDSLWEPLTYPISFDDNDKLACDFEQKKSFWKHVFTITQISDQHIANFRPGVHQAKYALRWLSKRETTRDEDMAYCLIGLLGIPLTISYGEGMQAFYRLQVEILQRTSDMGLFAWLGHPSSDNSMLASEPKCFSSTVPIILLFHRDRTVPISITGHGLHITLMAYKVKNSERCATSGCGFISLHMDGLDSTVEAVELQTADHDQAELRNTDNDDDAEEEVQTSDDDNGAMELQTLDDKLELAILGEIRGSKPQEYLAILLRSKNGQCKRIPTKNHIKLSLPMRREWPKPTDRYIQ